MLSAKDKVVVVTGASAGLGRALALQAAKRGARVALLARREKKLREVRREIQELGGEAGCYPVDVSDGRSVWEAFAEVENEWGRIDAVFNNAGIIQPIAPLHECDDDELMELFRINIFGAFVVAREAITQMRKQTRGGTLVNITSGAAAKVYPGWSAYGASKAAMDQMTRVVAAENAGLPVRVFAIAPGVFDSHMQTTIRNTPVEKFPRRQKFIDLHQKGQLPHPAEVAAALAEIAFTDWPELNGQIRDIRDPAFQQECLAHGVRFPESIRTGI